VVVRGQEMKLKEKAETINENGMDADSIASVHCPSWYGLPNIEGCPRAEVIQVSKRKTAINYIKTLDKCHECWNREI
jgi:hypothetical protein